MAHRELKATRQPSVWRCHPDLSSRPQPRSLPGYHHPNLEPGRSYGGGTLVNRPSSGYPKPRQKDVLDVRVPQATEGAEDRQRFIADSASKVDVIAERDASRSASSLQPGLE